MVTFIGPLARFSFAGFTFYKDEAREVPPAVVEQLRGHPWFSVPEKVKRNARKG
jgi:hypothetical protein